MFRKMIDRFLHPKMEGLLLRFMILDVLMFPCVLWSFWRLMGWDTYNLFWAAGYDLSTLPIVFLQIFLLPEIAAILFCIRGGSTFLRDIRRKQLKKNQFIVFLILLTVFLFGFASMKEVFLGQMSV